MTTQQLRVDWPSCRARGLCFELLPEVIELDDWGYPVITGEVTAEQLAAARCGPGMSEDGAPPAPALTGARRRPPGAVRTACAGANLARQASSIPMLDP